MWIYRNVFGRFNEIEGLGDHFKFIQLERNYFTESLCQCTLNVYWLLIIFINVTYITENDKLDFITLIIFADCLKNVII